MGDRYMDPCVSVDKKDKDDIHGQEHIHTLEDSQRATQRRTDAGVEANCRYTHHPKSMQRMACRKTNLRSTIDINDRYQR